MTGYGTNKFVELGVIETPFITNFFLKKAFLRANKNLNIAMYSVYVRVHVSFTIVFIAYSIESLRLFSSHTYASPLLSTKKRMNVEFFSLHSGNEIKKSRLQAEKKYREREIQ